MWHERWWKFNCLKILILIVTMQEKSSGQTLQANLRIDRTEKAAINEPVSFSCILSSSLPIMTTDLCIWITPHGKIITGNSLTGEVKENNTLVPGWSATAANNKGRNCSLFINVTKAEDFGRWSCKLDGMPFHMGTFYLLNKMEGTDYVTDVRLPRQIVPHIYDITLIPILEENNFTTLGFVKIHFSINSSNLSPDNAKKIYIHHKDILIDEQSTKVTNAMEQTVNILGHEYDLERDFYVAHLEMATFSTISMNFTSILNRNLIGFYRSSYYDESLKTFKYLAVSTFSPNDARHAFPCMDEPDMKAMFNVKLGRKKNMSARSNMDIIGTEPIEGMEGYEMDTFRQSVPMSTYIVGFMVSEFAHTSNLINDSFKIWCNPAKTNTAKFAADVGLRILKYLEQYFDVPYPLPKMDMAAIPDFKYSAMENWGLVTYQEYLLLYDEDSKNPGYKEQIVSVIGHELTHHWFGNLVTMSWWTNLWLKEGFASYGESIGMEYILPEHKYDDHTIFSSLHPVLEKDANENAMATSEAVLDPDKRNIFNYLAYDRGECLVRMMEAFLTPTTFWKGVKRYLKKFQYQNVERKDLWDALEQAVIEDNITLPYKMDVIMENWTLQAGFPLVTVTLLTEDDRIYLDQKRFIFNPKLEQNSSYENARWHIPVSIEYPGGNFEDGKADVWLLPNQEKTEFRVQQGTPYVINVRSRGLYRVNYDTNNWKRLALAMLRNHSSIHLLSRARINDDSFMLARAGQLHYNLSMDLSRYLVMERDFVPMKAMLNQFKYINMILEQKEVYPLWKMHLLKLLSDAFDESLGVHGNTTYPNVLKHAELIHWMCFVCGHPNCTREAANQFEKWMNIKNPDLNNPIPHPLRDSIYGAVMRAAKGQEKSNFLFERLPKANDDAKNLAIGLGSTLDMEVLLELLSMTVNNSPVLSSHRSDLYKAMGVTPMGRRLQFDWLRNNYDKLKKMTNFDSMVESIVGIFLEGITEITELEEVEKFQQKTAELSVWINKKNKFGKKLQKMEVRSMRREMEEEQDSNLQDKKILAEGNIKWIENYYEIVATWLKAEYEQIGTMTSNATTIAITTNATAMGTTSIEIATNLTTIRMTTTHSTTTAATTNHSTTTAAATNHSTTTAATTNHSTTTAATTIAETTMVVLSKTTKKLTKAATKKSKKAKTSKKSKKPKGKKGSSASQKLSIFWLLLNLLAVRTI